MRDSRCFPCGHFRTFDLFVSIADNPVMHLRRYIDRKYQRQKGSMRSEPQTSAVPNCGNLGFDIFVIAEMAITVDVERDLIRLLDNCFPDTFEGRSHFKQLPHARLIHRQDGEIVGQAFVWHG